MRDGSNAEESWLAAAINALLALLGTCLLARGVWLGFIVDENAMAMTYLGAGLLFLFAATLDRFKALKGMGVELQMREFDQKIGQADAILAQLKRLAELSGASLLELAAGTGRWDGAPSPLASYELSRSVKGMLESLGSTSLVVRRALVPWARSACIDAIGPVVGQYAEAVFRHYWEMHRRFVAAFSDADPNDPDQQAAKEAARQRVDEVLSYCRPVRDRGVADWSLESTPSRLRELVDSAPAFVPKDALDELRQQANLWGPELEYLARELDFRDKESWFAKLAATRIG
ncbi:MAG TPA: hypothetical protein VF169_07520 [Albitalea sp.]|uniref:hypothetical protein n=1 Tax=Piscinibacter sp. TaxID=1903157 RepID=UPI002ED241B1